MCEGMALGLSWACHTQRSTGALAVVTCSVVQAFSSWQKLGRLSTCDSTGRGSLECSPTCGIFANGYEVLLVPWYGIALVDDKFLEDKDFCPTYHTVPQIADSGP